MINLRLLAAFQVLRMPEGAYRSDLGVATHELARDTIGELTGHRPVGDFPELPAGQSVDLDGYMDWLSLDQHLHSAEAV